MDELLKHVVPLQGIVHSDYGLLPATLQAVWHSLHFQFLPAYMKAKGREVKRHMCASPVLALSPFPRCRALCSSSCFALVSPLPLSLLQGVVRQAIWRLIEGGEFQSGAHRPRAEGPMLSSLLVSSLALICSPHTTRPPVPLPSWPRLTPTLGPSSYPSFRLRCLLPSHPMLSLPSLPGSNCSRIIPH